DPYMDMAAKGQLDFSKVGRFVKLESGTRLAGLLNADMHMKGNLSAVEKQQLDRFDASGSLELTNFAYASTAYPSGINLDHLQMSFNPKNVTLSDLKGVYGKTHFNAHGTVNNLPVYILKHKPLDGSLTVQADELNLNELMSSMNTGGKSTAGGGAAPADTTKAAPTTAFAVPSNIDFTLAASVDRVIYDKLLLQHVTGNLVIADEAVRLENVRAEGLDGTMGISGTYSTKNGVKSPDISFSYDLQQLDVQKTYSAFVNMQQLMPAAKYIAGKFSSKLNMKGVLGADMKPDLNSLTGGGNVLLANGALKGFAPTDELAKTLHLESLKDITLKDIKTSFTFRNGRVIVDPFPVKLKDIDMEVGGTHGFDQTLDYSIDMKLPRGMLGGDANNLMNSVAATAAAHGATINMKEKIDLPVKVGGTATRPVIKADVKGALTSTAASLKQQAAGMVQAKVDSAKQQLKDTAKAVGQQLVKSATDELQKKLLGKGDTTAAAGNGAQDAKDKIKSAGKGLLDGLLNKKKSN
ncbi:MAG TPA: AsmA-like C-terminal region-containing protein, partial [Puia sp.]